MVASCARSDVCARQPEGRGGRPLGASGGRGGGAGRSLLLG
jgi:hypothetical protein